MGWMQFVASLAESLSWPMAAVWIVFLFRRALIDRIPALSKVTFPGGVSAEFDKRVVEIAAVSPIDRDAPVDAEVEAPAVDNAMDEQPELPKPVPSTVSRQPHSISGRNNDPPITDTKALHANPNGVVMEAWKTVEFALLAIAKNLAPNLQIIPLPLSPLLELLLARGAIVEKDEEMIRKMYEMRNLAAHTEEAITESGALRYKEIALKTAQRLWKAGKMLSEE